MEQVFIKPRPVIGGTIYGTSAKSKILGHSIV